MAKPYSIVPPREPLGFIDGKPVEVSRVWWRFFSSLFTTTGSGQPGGGGNDDLTDLFNLAFSTIEPAGTDVDSRLNEIDVLLQAGRSESAAEPVSPDADTLMLLTGHRVQGSDPRVDVLLSAARQPQAQEPRADLLLPGRKGTDFDAVTAELRKLILAIRPQRVPSASDLGLGTMAFQNANAVAITGGTIVGVASPQFTVGMALATTPFPWTGTNIGFDVGAVGTFAASSSGAVVGSNYYAGATNIYKTSAGASRLRVTTALLSFDLAPPGTAGTSATLVTQWQIDGVGNVLHKFGTADQSYSRQVPTTGFAITLSATSKTLILDPAGTLASGTITMPASPIDGQEIRIVSTQIITALTLAGNTGQTVKNAPTTLAPSTTGPMGFAFIYDLALTTWYRTQ